MTLLLCSTTAATTDVSPPSLHDALPISQLTSGPVYDYQPDWSPDGRTVVFARYAHDRIELELLDPVMGIDRKSTRLNSSHRCTSYAVFCLKKKIKIHLYETSNATVCRHP